MTDGMATPSEALDEEGNTNDSAFAATSLHVNILIWIDIFLYIYIYIYTLINIVPEDLQQQ